MSNHIDLTKQDSTKDLTLVIYKDLNNSPLLSKELQYIFVVILIGLNI